MGDRMLVGIGVASDFQTQFLVKPGRTLVRHPGAQVVETREPQLGGGSDGRIQFVDGESVNSILGYP